VVHQELDDGHDDDDRLRGHGLHAGQLTFRQAIDELNRFSEDMDFALGAPDSSFELSRYGRPRSARLTPIAVSGAFA
jgi:hypothetical protein